jgi:hypothetical protein
VTNSRHFQMKSDHLSSAIYSSHQWQWTGRQPQHSDRVWRTFRRTVYYTPSLSAGLPPAILPTPEKNKKTILVQSRRYSHKNYSAGSFIYPLLFKITFITDQNFVHVRIRMLNKFIINHCGKRSDKHIITISIWVIQFLMASKDFRSVTSYTSNIPCAPRK